MPGTPERFSSVRRSYDWVVEHRTELDSALI